MGLAQKLQIPQKRTTPEMRDTLLRRDNAKRFQQPTDRQQRLKTVRQLPRQRHLLLQHRHLLSRARDEIHRPPEQYVLREGQFKRRRFVPGQRQQRPKRVHMEREQPAAAGASHGAQRGSDLRRLAASRRFDDRNVFRRHAAQTVARRAGNSAGKLGNRRLRQSRKLKNLQQNFPQ